MKKYFFADDKPQFKALILLLKGFVKTNFFWPFYLSLKFSNTVYHINLFPSLLKLLFLYSNVSATLFSLSKDVIFYKFI